MEQPTNLSNMNKVYISTPDSKSTINTPVAVASSIFTRDEKNNAFGDKIYQRISSILSGYDVIYIQQITNHILDHTEQEICNFLVDQAAFKSIVEKYRLEVQKNISDLNSKENSEQTIKEDENKGKVSQIAEEKCAICLDVLGSNNKSVTPCGHHFCFTCLYQAMDKQNNCPLCRAQLIQNKKRKMRKLSDEAMADIITETMNDFNLRRHIRSAELFSNNRNNMDSDDIICSSVQIYSLQLANNIQRQQLSKNYYYDDEDDSDEEDDEEEEDEEYEEQEV